MIETVTYRVTGSRAEVEGLERAIRRTDIDLQYCEFSVKTPSPLDEQPFGHQELVDLVVSIAVSLGTNAGYDTLKHTILQYVGRRRHMRLREDRRMNPDGSDPDGSDPDGSDPDGSDPDGSDPDDE